MGTFFKGAIDDASDLSESASKVGVVFGDSANQILAASKTSAKAMGLTKSAYLGATGSLGNLLVSLEIAPKRAANMSQEMVKLAGDLASFNNVSPEDALAALQSGLTGETEPLKKFGVNMNDATLKAQALKMGLIKTTKDALTPQNKALSAQALIMAQTKTAQGDFARTSGGLANQQRILAARFGDVKATIGKALLPAMTGIVTFANDRLFPAFASMGDKAREAKDKIGAAFQKLNLGPVARKIMGAFKGVDLSNLAANFAAQARGWAEPIIEGFKTGLDAGDWSGLGLALGNGIVRATQGLTSLVSKISSALTAMFAKVDWIGLGIKVGTFAIPFAVGLATGILNGVTEPALWKGIWDHLPEILLAGMAIAFAPAKLVGPLAKILGRIPFVGTFLARAVTWVNEIGSKFGKKLLDVAGSAVKLFWKGFTEVPLPGAGFITRVLGAIKGLPGRLKDFWLTIETRIGVWAIDAFEAAAKGAGKGARSLLSFVASLPGMILRALGALARLLAPRGVELVTGFLRGISSRFPGVIGFVRSIPGRIAGGIGNLGSLLFNSGADLIRGLIGGIKSMVGSAIAAAGNIASGVANTVKSKLGIHSPSKVFHKIGNQTVQGLADGIKKTTPEAEKSAKELAEKVAKALEKRIDKIKDTITKLQDSLKGLRGAMGGLDMSSALGITAANPTTAAVRSELAEFRKAIKDAGGEWTKRLEGQSERMLNQARAIDRQTRALDKETTKRDSLVQSLSDQQQALDALRQTMAAFSSQVGGNFMRSSFGQSVTTSTQAMTSSPALTAMQDQLDAAQKHLAQIRASATGDNLSAIAEASRLIPTIADLQKQVADETARLSQTTDTTITGLDLLKQMLEEDTAHALGMTAALAKLGGVLDPSIYKGLAESGDWQTANQLASLTAGELAQVNALVASRDAAVASLAATTTKQVFGTQQQQLQTGVDSLVGKVAESNRKLADMNAANARHQAKILAVQEKQTDVIRTQGELIRAALSDQARQLAEATKKAKV